MKRILLLVISIVATQLITRAQLCTPQWTGGSSGIIPDTFQNLPPAYVNVPYEEVVQFKVPLTDTMGGIVVSVDHVELTGVDGLSTIPASVAFGYGCNPATCSFKADSVGCVKISGTPTTEGVYPLVIQTKAYISPIVFLPLSVTGYRIEVRRNVGIPAIDPFKFDVSQNVPNPVKSQTDVYINLPKPANIICKVSNVLGNIVLRQSVDGKKGVNTLSINAGNLPSGIYFYSISNGEQEITKRLVIDKK